MKFISFFYIALCFLISCSSNDKIKYDIVRHDDRNSTINIELKEKNYPILKVETRYIGKKPQQPVKSKINRDWKTYDTDFYQITFINLTDNFITFLSLDYWLEKGKLYTTKKKNQAQIAEKLGTYIIPPGKTVTRSNSYVWSTYSSNRLHKVYKMVYQNKTFEFDVPLFYKK